ncbi:MAG: type II secretion system F family protein [bacterium]|nr:type II secretion system F family protein [bacterium]
MPLYKYKAKSKTGEVYERAVEAADKFALYKIIREEGGTVVSIKEATGLGILNSSFSFSLGSFFGGIKTQQKINFAKNLGSMIKAGLPVTRAISVMGKQTKSKSLKSLLADLEADVSHGTTLSEALNKRPKVFSGLFVSMVKAGEESGSVSGSLAIVGNQMEKSYLLIKKVRGALIYPAVILSVMVILAILLLIFMVPTLTATFEGLGVALPLPTRIIIFLSDFLVNNTILVLGTLLVLCAGLTMFLRSKTGRELVDSAVLRLPVIGEMIREVQAARTARTLSSLLSAGVEIVVALDVTIDVMQNHLYKEALTRARDAIQKGEAMSAVFVGYEHLYPLFVGEMIAVGEETGKIAEMLLGVATFYEDEVDQKTKDLSTIIEPVLMIIIGIGVGIFAISMLMPTYSLVDYI